MSINHINAGLIFGKAKMNGLDLTGALHYAHICDLEPKAHRATVCRVLRVMWVRHHAEAARSREIAAGRTEYDAACREHDLVAWDAACALAGAERREAKRVLRRAYDAAVA